jgi:hypothetical protein
MNLVLETMSMVDFESVSTCASRVVTAKQGLGDTI